MSNASVLREESLAYPKIQYKWLWGDWDKGVDGGNKKTNFHLGSSAVPARLPIKKLAQEHYIKYTRSLFKGTGTS